ncbi:SpoIIE family protein phosphatase [Kitasatospora sp. NPDC058218]|uniref:SpoIIE family protein phosphatase n=1 Tax=Kitasatospora sp. NPDC058218 TaxID=3346385 RepID=UPI0036D86456
MTRGEHDAGPGPVNEAVLDALLTLSPVGLHVLDTELRVVRINTATPAMRGIRAEDFLGHRFTEVYDLADPAEAEAVARGVLETGVPVLDRIIRIRPRQAPQDEHLHSISAFRLADRHGRALGLAIAVVDVTDRERARSGLALLEAVHRSVGRTLDTVVTCQELVDVLVPDFADVAVVEVVDAVVRGEDPPFAPLPTDVPLRRLAFRSSAGGHPPQAHPVGDVRAIPAPTPFALSLADLQPRRVALGADPSWLAAAPAHATAIRSSGAHTLITAPLALRGTVFGLVSLYRTAPTAAFREDDLAVARQIADHAALCIDNAHRYTREHAIAATLERHLLPRRLVSHVALETAVAPLSPSGSGGWYDTLALSGARTALVVGDVAGTGINATAAMGQLRTVIHSLAAFDLEPDELLARLHDASRFLAAERASLPPTDPLHREALAANCVYAVYDPLTHSCTAARAGGQPAPVIVRPDGTVDVPDIPAGPPLGGTDSTPFAATTFELPEGSTLVLAGVPDADEAPAGIPAALQGVHADADRPLRELCDDVLYRLHASDRRHEAMLLLARARAFPADRVAVWPLEAVPAAVATARAHVRARLEAWRVDEETAFNTELIVSELVTNAIRYGAPPLELRLINDRMLTCEVRDHSLAAPHLRHARTVDEGGRGLFIVSQLAQLWGTRFTAEGKTLWTEQQLPPRPAGAAAPYPAGVT